MGVSPVYSKRPAMEEIINDPTNNRHYWQFRFHVPIEDLIADRALMTDIQELLLSADPS
jgi:4-alpha-glucanotransferase